MLVFFFSVNQANAQVKNLQKNASFNGTKTIGTTGADYTSITAALSAANTAGLDGAVVLSLQADYNSASETYPLTIGNINGSSATNTITIRPAATGLSISSNNTTATIYFNGGNYVTIDGRVNGIGSTKDLVITNTSTASGGSAIRFINDASNNTIKYAKLSSSYGANGPAIVIFSNTNGSTGNDNNTIDHCDLDGKAGATASPVTAGTAAIGVYSLGSETTSATYNSNNTISNCNIFDNFNSESSANFGIFLLSGNTDWTITGNSFYQTSARITTVDFIQMNVIHLVCANGGNFTISNNYIGGTAPNAGGSAMNISGAFTNKFRGISLSVNYTNPSSVQGNTIANINFSSSSNTSAIPGIFAGITIDNGSANIGTGIGNTIGSATGTGSIVTTTSGSGAISYGICSNSPLSVLNISNNNIGSIQTSGSNTSISAGFMGISNTGNLASVNINNNTIGSTTTANSIHANTASTSSTAQVITGISNTGSGAFTITNNTVANINNDYSPSSANTSNIIRGLICTQGTCSYTGNVVRNLSTSANATGIGSSASVVGIINTTASSFSISQNIIHTLANNNPSAITQVIGIYNSGPSIGNNVVARNFVHSLKLSTSDIGMIYGIYHAGGISTTKNNMIRLGIDELGVSSTSAYDIRGIYESSGTNQYYFNSVYIGGTNVASGTTNSYAFYSSITSNVRALQNNIFVNNRSNSSGSGIHVAYFISGSVPAPTGLASNYNIYYANGTGGILIRNGSTNYTLQAWRAASGLDLASHQADPNYISSTGNSSTVNLHVQSPTVAEANGTLIESVSDDYDGSTRATLSATDIGADAGTFTSVDGSPVNISYPTLTDGSTANKILTNFATITDNAGVSNTSKPRLYYKKSTESDAFSGNTNAANGWKYVIASNASSPYSFTIDYSLLNSTITNADVIEYFVVAQDASNNFNSLPEGAGYSTNPPVENINAKPSTVNSFTINTSTTSGTFNVGSGETYTSLTGAGGLFEFLNTKVLSGNIIINITSDLTETGTTSLNALGEEPYSSNFSITMQPNSSTLRTISATAVATGSPMINFNGTRNVTIDGRSGGSGQYLSFRNTNTTAANTGAAIQFTNGSINCTIRNVTIETNASNATRGNIVIGNTGVNNISISNNDIRDATAGTTGKPSNAIYSNYYQNTISVSSNNIYNFTNSGVLLTNVADGCNVSDNSLYATTTSSTTITAISIQTGNNHTITNNYIGGTSSSAGSTAWTHSGGLITGISTAGSYTTANSIQNNVIQNFNFTSPGGRIEGISTSSGKANIGTATGNTIGHSSTANSISLGTNSGTCAGIVIASSADVNITNNLIANITSSGTGTNSAFRGIYISGNANVNITNNIIRNLSSNSTSTSITTIQAIAGIVSQSSNNNQTISKNTIYALYSTATSAAINCIGILANNTDGEFLIKKNKIYDLKVATSSTTSGIYGIYINAGVSNIYNNMISIVNGANTNDPIIAGVVCKNASTKTNTIYYNTIRVAGTGSAGTNTNCLSRETAESTMLIKNNILVNERSGGTGKHYAIYNYSGSTGWSASASNYNVLYSTTSGTTGYWSGDQSFAGFQSASAGDANSKNVDVNFSDESNGDMHIAGASIGNANLNGVLLASITEDYDEQVRPSTTGIPYIGADEVTSNPLPITLLSFEGTAKTDFNLLIWTTASEINSNYFEIERLNSENEFENIGRVYAAKNSKEITHYQFHDATFNASNPIEYYRLKMLDRDEQFKFSDVIAVKRNSHKKISVTIYPNPSEDLVNIILSGVDEQKPNIRITDIMGKVVYQQEGLSSRQIFTLDMESLPSGIYTLQVLGLSENINQKFMKK